MKKPTKKSQAQKSKAQKGDAEIASKPSYQIPVNLPKNSVSSSTQLNRQNKSKKNPGRNNIRVQVKSQNVTPSQSDDIRMDEQYQPSDSRQLINNPNVISQKTDTNILVVNPSQEVRDYFQGKSRLEKLEKIISKDCKQDPILQLIYFPSYLSSWEQQSNSPITIHLQTDKNIGSDINLTHPSKQNENIQEQQVLAGQNIPEKKPNLNLINPTFQLCSLNTSNKGQNLQNSICQNQGKLIQQNKIINNPKLHSSQLQEHKCNLQQKTIEGSQNGDYQYHISKPRQSRSKFFENTKFDHLKFVYVLQHWVKQQKYDKFIKNYNKLSGFYREFLPKIKQEVQNTLKSQLRQKYKDDPQNLERLEGKNFHVCYICYLAFEQGNQLGGHISKVHPSQPQDNKSTNMVESRNLDRQRKAMINKFNKKLKEHLQQNKQNKMHLSGQFPIRNQDQPQPIQHSKKNKKKRKPTNKLKANLRTQIQS